MKNNQLVNLLKSCLFILIFTAVCCSKKNTIPGPSTTQGTDNANPGLATVTVDSIGSLSATSMTIYASARSGVSISDRGVYWGTGQHPTDNKTTATSYSSGNPGFQVKISGLQPNTTYWIRSYAVNSKGVAYSVDKQITTMSPPNHISVATDTMFASGAFTAFAAGTVRDSLAAGIKESGICIATSANPQITDRKIITPGHNDLDIFVRIDSLHEATNYNIRAYCINNFGRITYGPNVLISTIRRGHVTYSMVNEDPNADADTKAAYKRIDEATAKAVEYQNNFSTCEKTLSINYSPGTPTADAVNGGWINVGANPGYQRVGTILHEIEHTLGGGTSWFWPQLIVNGVCVGKHTNQILQFMTRNPTAKLYGDGLHSWPYGFNGNWEDTGVDMDYIIHCLLVQGMKKDGLPDAN